MHRYGSLINIINISVSFKSLYKRIYVLHPLSKLRIPSFDGAKTVFKQNISFTLSFTRILGLHLLKRTTWMHKIFCARVKG